MIIKCDLKIAATFFKNVVVTIVLHLKIKLQ